MSYMKNAFKLHLITSIVLSLFSITAEAAVSNNDSTKIVPFASLPNRIFVLEKGQQNFVSPNYISINQGQSTITTTQQCPAGMDARFELTPNSTIVSTPGPYPLCITHLNSASTGYQITYLSKMLNFQSTSQNMSNAFSWTVFCYPKTDSTQPQQLINGSQCLGVNAQQYDQSPIVWAHGFMNLNNPNFTFSAPLCPTDYQFPYIILSAVASQSVYNGTFMAIQTTQLCLTQAPQVTQFSNYLISYRNLTTGIDVGQNKQHTDFNATVFQWTLYCYPSQAAVPPYGYCTGS